MGRVGDAIALMWRRGRHWISMKRYDGQRGFVGPRVLVGLGVFLVASGALASDQPQWGEAWSRNQVSSETGIPASFDPDTGRNIRWTARLGTEAHATPVVADGRVYIGTNNQEPRDPKHQGDRGVLMCLDERTGELQWQLVVPKRDEDPYFDWPKSGISSPATVEGDRVYVVSNRGEVLCLDAKGLGDGNDRPYQDEGLHMTPPYGDRPAPGPRPGAAIAPERLELAPGVTAMKPDALDADILWIFDMVEEAGIWPHDGAHSSILIRGEHLYLNTGTGVDNTHKAIRRPEAPSLIVLDKNTGRYLAREREGIAPNIFHCTWSAPSMTAIEGQDQIVYAAGNGVVYGFEPLIEAPASGEVATLKALWRYDFDPEAPKTEVHRYHQNKREGPSNFYGLPVALGEHVYVAGGGDLWWGKNGAWLKKIDASGQGDLTDSGTVWSVELGRHVFSTPAVWEDLVFVADNSRFVYCFDANTGQLHWRHEARGDFWASPYVVDGKVFIGSRRGDFWVFAASDQLNVLAEIDLGAPVSATAVAANGTLYVATMFHLHAIAQEGTF